MSNIVIIYLYCLHCTYVVFFHFNDSETHVPLEPPIVCSFKEGFQLCVLPGHVMLARLNEDRPLADCSNILVRNLLSMMFDHTICLSD
jgi:hypothetical protein